MRVMRATVSVVFGVLIPRAAIMAQASAPAPVDRCHDVLVQTTLTKVDDEWKQIAYLHTIRTEQDWESARSGGAGLAGMFSGAPATISASYSDFQRWQRAAFEHTDYKMSDDEAHHLQTVFLPPEAIDAWRDCLAHSAGGVTLSLVATDSETARVRVSWRYGSSPTPGHPRASVHLAPSAGKVIGQWPIPSRVNADYDGEVLYRRPARGPLIVTVAVSGLGAGEIVSEPLVLPVEPLFVHGCMWSFPKVFSHVPPDANNDTYYDLPACKHLKPGALVRVGFDNATVEIDHDQQFWVVMGLSVTAGLAAPGVPLARDWGSQDFDVLAFPNGIGFDDHPQAFNHATHVIVPWDGIVITTVRVNRGLYHGPQATQAPVSAKSGTYSVKAGS